MRLFYWILKKLITRERKKQIFVYGYTPEHDNKELKANPYHLLDEAQAHYNWGHPIQALALMEAQKDYTTKMYQRIIDVGKFNSSGTKTKLFSTRLSEDK